MKTFLTLLELGPVWDWLSRSQITERPSCDERNAWRYLCALCFSSCHLTSFQNRAPRTQMHITLTPYSHIRYQSGPTRLPSGLRGMLGHETIDSEPGVKALTMPRENICGGRQKNGNYAAQRWSQSKFHNRTQNTYGLNEELPQSNNQSGTELKNSRPPLGTRGMSEAAVTGELRWAGVQKWLRGKKDEDKFTPECSGNRFTSEQEIIYWQV